MADSKIETFVFLSTAGAIYKSEKEEVFTEVSDVSLQSPYAKEKLAAEKLITDQFESRVSVLLLRPTNIYGPGQCLNRGMGIIPLLFNSSRKNELVTLYEPISSERDYIYISDFIDALMMSIVGRYPSGIYNISSETNLSLQQMIENFNKVNEMDIAYQCEVKIEANYSMIKSSKFRSISSWKPKVNIIEGLSKTREWHNR